MPGWHRAPDSAFPRTDYGRLAEQARKLEEEVKRLHQLIVDTNNQKLKAQQDKIDKIDTEIDECSSAITKAQVAAKSANRYSTGSPRLEHSVFVLSGAQGGKGKSNCVVSNSLKVTFNQHFSSICLNYFLNIT